MTDEKHDETTVFEIPTAAGTIAHTVILFEGVTYRLPVGVVNVAVERLIEMATGCGPTDCGPDFTGVRVVSVEERCAEALAFLFGACRAQTEEEIQRAVAAELGRLGGGALAAREVYANLIALHGWMGLFWGDFSSRFLCEKHQHVWRMQDHIAAAYQEEDLDDDEPQPHVRPTGVPSEAAARMFGEKPSRRAPTQEH